ncbi:putative methyltransferase-domain-containing protein [Cryomyces antarcticus]
MGDSVLVEDVAWEMEVEEPLHVFDLPQIYTKPSAQSLLFALSRLKLGPPSWEATPSLTRGSHTPRSTIGTSTPVRRSRPVNPDGITKYLTNIVSSPLKWIEVDETKEQIWETASMRLSERSGRTGMGAMSRAFRIPRPPASKDISGGQLYIASTSLEIPNKEEEEYVDLVIHEPALTADNLGHKTWASSYLLAKRLCMLDLPLPAVQGPVLELGSGTGLAGVAAAAVLNTSVVLTDLAEIVPNLTKNIEANRNLIESNGGSARIVVLDWTKPGAFEAQINGARSDGSNKPFPLILAADPLYSPEHPRLLVQTIDFWLDRSKDSRVVLELPLREAYATEREDFRHRMEDVGLRILEQDEETGFDDWGGCGKDVELTEVRCWLSIWGW